MKKLSVSLLILATALSSPNFGTLFTLNSTSALCGGVFQAKRNPSSVLKKEDNPVTKVSLDKTVKKPRLLKRTLFDVDLREALSIHLLVFCLSLVFFCIAISRKPALLFLRSPPQF